MKLKTLSLIAGAIALTLTATPFAVQAQTNFSSPMQIAEGKGKGMWEKLGLTDTQKAQMEQIKRNSRSQMEGVLTSEQKAKLKTMMQERQGQGQGQGRKPGKGFASLNLTDAQKNQMRQIRESAKQQMQAILTPAQRQQMEQFKEQRSLRRQGRNVQ